MSVPSSVEELIQLIRKSGMIDEQKLSAYLQRREFARGLPTDPREFADDMIRDGVLTYFQAEQFLLGKWRGFTIGKYKLLERVGVGGMGQVFLCEHMFMKKRVAIKVLPPAKAEQPAALGRFYREARAAGSLQHANIVRTHDIDQDGNLHFIVMDYVDGPNLLDVVKKFGPMEIGRAVSYIRQTAGGLDYAFRSGIIHRDVKPGNVLIDRRGLARILDLGLARFFRDHTDQLTIKYDDKIVLGTADYVAPEQVANSHSVDIRADVYALGATFYFLLAGHPPFPTGTVSQKLLWHRTKEPTPIQQIRPEIPDGLAAIVARMMVKDPKARYQTPAQVAAELDPWVPAVVTLPAGDEMPQLSPAATEGAGEEMGETADEPVGTTPGAAIARAGAAVLAEPRAPVAPPAPGPFGPPPVLSPSPFGPSSPATSPWAPRAKPFDTKSGQRPGIAAHPQPSAVDTAAGPMEQPPPGTKPGRDLPTNPFRVDAAGPPPTKLDMRKLWPWIAIGGGAVIALLLAVIVALA
ncbi:MAG: serine/threonine protein kinase [Gemmataceae bacterium]|nr:serine/threonine protein kinase [Gemmataceae bacterium]